MERLDKPLLNSALGEFQSLLQLIALLFENGALEHSVAVAAVTSTCELFAKATEPFHFAQATVQSLQNLLDGLNPVKQARASLEGPTVTHPAEPGMADERLLSALTGPAKRVCFRLQEKEYAINRAVQHREKMQEVLQLQAATASRLLQEKREPLRCVEEIESALAGLREIDLHTHKSLSHQVRQTVSFARPEELLEQAGKLRRGNEDKREESSQDCFGSAGRAERLSQEFADRVDLRLLFFSARSGDRAGSVLCSQTPIFREQWKPKDLLACCGSTQLLERSWDFLERCVVSAWIDGRQNWCQTG